MLIARDVATTFVTSEIVLSSTISILARDVSGRAQEASEKCWQVISNRSTVISGEGRKNRVED